MAAKKIEAMSYEEAYAELEKIATDLENENQSLEDSIALFENGQKLAAHCSTLLEKAQLRIQKIELNSIGQKEDQ